MADNPTFGLPTPQLALTDPKTGLVASIWYQFLARLAQLTPERPFEPVTVGASPFTYQAYTIGHLCIAGGTVSARSLVRGGITVSAGNATFIPVAANDQVVVTYSGLPTVTFIPSARA